MKIAAVGVVLLAVTLVGGCQGANTRDLEGVEPRTPDKIEAYVNIDGQPNLSRLCIDGVAFLTNSREHTAVMRVPEWDGWCKG